MNTIKSFECGTKWRSTVTRHLAIVDQSGRPFGQHQLLAQSLQWLEMANSGSATLARCRAHSLALLPKQRRGSQGRQATVRVDLPPWLDIKDAER